MIDCLVVLGEERLDGMVDLALQRGRAGHMVEDPRD